MKTRTSLKPTDALLVGKLTVQTRHPGGRPELSLDVWCPYCHRSHSHGWSDPPFLSNAVSHRIAHCPEGSPLHAAGYYVGLDPNRADENQAAREAFLKAYRSWQSRAAALAKI